MDTKQNLKYKILESSVLGQPIDKSKKITIVGAGIAGLFLGYYLKKAGFDFQIIERKDHCGGMLQTYKTNFGLVENAAFSFRWGKEIIALCNDLNLDVIKASDLTYKKYILRDNKFKRLPLSVTEILKTLKNVFFSKVKYPQTLEDFGKENLSAAATSYFLEPAFQGIYGTSSKNLSFPAVLPNVAKTFNEKEFMFWQVLKIAFEKKNKDATQKPLGFNNGMRELVNALENYLKDHIKTKANLKSENVDLKEDTIFLCVPAFEAALYFKNELSNILKKVSYNKLVTATIFIRKESLMKFKPGFGCLIPEKEGLNTMGVIYNDLIFPQRSTSIVSSLTLILGDKQGNLIDKTIAEIEAILYKEMTQIFNFNGVFLDSKIVKWKKALPVYSPELYNSWFKINNYLSEHNANIRLFSNYTGQISIRGMCTSAKKYVEMNS